MTAEQVTEEAAQTVLDAVAAWMGRENLGPQPGTPPPTGAQAAAHALGPHLVMDWDWPGRPTPTILLEGCADHEWAYHVSMDEQMLTLGGELNVYLEPYAGYALCIYPG